MKVVRSLLEPDDLAAQVAAGYDLGGGLTCRIHSLGDNDNYTVRCGGESFILRIYTHRKHWDWGRGDRLFELEWLDFVAERGVPVAPPVRRTDGGLLAGVPAPEGERDMALFPLITGVPDPFPEDPGRTFRVGAAIARLHAVSDGFQPRHPRFSIDLGFLVEAPLRRIAAFLGEAGRGEELALISELARRVRRGLAGLTRAAPAWGIIGGDFHGGNHVFTPEGEPIFFDFDLCGYGWRAYDLAVPLWQARRERGTECALALAPPLLAGYGSVRKLAEPERRALPDLVLARQLWLIGEHVADVDTLGEARIGDEYWHRTAQLLRAWLDEPLELAS